MHTFYFTYCVHHTTKLIYIQFRWDNNSVRRRTHFTFSFPILWISVESTIVISIFIVPWIVCIATSFFQVAAHLPSSSSSNICSTRLILRPFNSKPILLYFWLFSLFIHTCILSTHTRKNKLQKKNYQFFR